MPSLLFGGMDYYFRHLSHFKQVLFVIGMGGFALLYWSLVFFMHHAWATIFAVLMSAYFYSGLRTYRKLHKR